jgi:hypothetical protein
MSYLRISAGECPTTRDVLVRCIEADARQALLEPAALPPAFFDLSSGEAGDLVQGSVNYGIRMAVVTPDLARYSESFQAFVKEANRGRQCRFFQSRTSAEAWLRSAEHP